ncbi:DUF6163 family protein [Aquibium sp. A9E412]|uniref:DUF6163 family protein n=1 Tax=Aquibium sp. A9E412 TaxID=2976767 RepID=UPI0025B1677A|nr:DUF6163 family protein [Aquibium sp. A9E412]MDN2564962.1 DUF6163 family protein [Aquibium sp. A9E412]
MTVEPVDGVPAHGSPAENLFALLHRLAAAYCLVLGVLYWVRLVGLYDGALWRFDLMPLHWQVAAVSLAVMLPFAAVGLWSLSSWGVVIWAVCAAAETTMYAGFADLYGAEPLRLALHGAIALAYAVLQVLLYRERRAREA